MQEELVSLTLRDRIEELGPWFHNLRLGGLQTAPSHFLGDYPDFKWRCFADALPQDLSGCTVLDIGCNGRFYSLEMKRRGAKGLIRMNAICAKRRSPRRYQDCRSSFTTCRCMRSRAWVAGSILSCSWASCTTCAIRCSHWT
jgi:hypothetical protein